MLSWCVLSVQTLETGAASIFFIPFFPATGSFCCVYIYLTLLQYTHFWLGATSSSCHCVMLVAGDKPSKVGRSCDVRLVAEDAPFLAR
jgi:hypothetical protein